jgi:hypothetical protein
MKLLLRLALVISVMLPVACADGPTALNEPERSTVAESEVASSSEAPYLADAVSGNVALSDIANAALHEAMHALSSDPENDHPDGPIDEPFGVWSYAEQPFSYLNPGVDSCVLYSG